MNRPAAFMSYADPDNARGRLTTLSEHLSRGVIMRIGTDFEVFLDRNSTEWAQNWKERIEESFDQVTFLIPIITPSFFDSQTCREELRQFLDVEKEVERNNLILPIYYIDTPLLDDAEKRQADDLILAIHTRQYVDLRKLHNMPFGSPEVLRKLRELADRIIYALEELEEEPLREAPYAPPAEAPQESSAPAYEPLGGLTAEAGTVYVCPRGDFEWSQQNVGERVPKCPNHEIPLVLRDRAENGEPLDASEEARRPWWRKLF